ncbi:MAG: nucleotidyltransferase family protein [Sphingomonadales bacterium]
MRFEDHLSSILSKDQLRRAALKAVRSLDLPDCWIGAGFVRDAVWDHLHGLTITPPVGDVDVIWFDQKHASEELDKEIEAGLRDQHGEFRWSVKNQARMHLQNGDAAYRSAADAMRFWPETATAVAVRLTADGTLDINAPLGLSDLFALRLVPTSSFVAQKRHIFDRRITEKGWLARYPLLSQSPWPP